MQHLNDTLLMLAIRTARGWRSLTFERGQTLGEYGLALSVIALAVIVIAVFVFRNAVVDAYNAATPCLDGGC